jgi:hypothetical protein
MKLFALIAAVSAEWNGVSEDNSCGMQLSGDSMVNSTCTISGSNIKTVFAGNGAFITGAGYAVTGFDGISGNVDAVVFFDQDCSTGECDNSTCWDAAVSCVDNGAASAGVFFMETVNDDRQAKGANYNLQIAGVSNGDVLSIDLAGFACQNITAPFGVVDADPDAWGNQYSDNGVFSVTVGDEPFGDLFQISITQQPGQTSALNLWESSVSA